MFETELVKNTETSPKLDDLAVTHEDADNHKTSTKRISSDSSDVQAELEQTGPNQLEREEFNSNDQTNLQNQIDQQKVSLHTERKNLAKNIKMGKNPAVDLVFGYKFDT